MLDYLGSSLRVKLLQFGFVVRYFLVVKTRKFREEGPKVRLAPFPKFSVREIINDNREDFEVSY